MTKNFQLKFLAHLSPLLQKSPLTSSVDPTYLSGMNWEWKQHIRDYLSRVVIESNTLEKYLGLNKNSRDLYLGHQVKIAYTTIEPSLLLFIFHKY